MSLGEYKSNNSYNNNNKKKTVQVYSAYGMSNTESAVDITKFGSMFWNNMLVLSISPKKTNSEDWEDDDKKIAKIYLTHTKARMLYTELISFITNPSEYSSIGVTSGAGVILISNGVEYGVNGAVISIRKLDTETGVLVSEYAYQIKNNYHYSVRNVDRENPTEFDKVYHDTLELEQIATLLRTYYEAMTGATAYTVMDNMKYDMSRLNTKLDSCCEKLGVEYKSNTKNNNGGGKSPFDKSEGRTFNRGSIEDMM